MKELIKGKRWEELRAYCLDKCIAGQYEEVVDELVKELDRLSPIECSIKWDVQQKLSEDVKHFGDFAEFRRRLSKDIGIPYHMLFVDPEIKEYKYGSLPENLEIQGGPDGIFHKGCTSTTWRFLEDQQKGDVVGVSVGYNPDYFKSLITREEVSRAVQDKSRQDRKESLEKSVVMDHLKMDHSDLKRCVELGYVDPNPWPTTSKVYEEFKQEYLQKPVSSSDIYAEEQYINRLDEEAKEIINQTPDNGYFCVGEIGLPVQRVVDLIYAGIDRIEFTIYLDVDTEQCRLLDEQLSEEKQAVFVRAGNETPVKIIYHAVVSYDTSTNLSTVRIDVLV